MSSNAEKLERLSARLDKDSQEKASYLLKLGYAPTELVKEGIDLLYQKEIHAKCPSIPAILNTMSSSNGEGPADLSVRHKDYFKDLLIEKHTG